jgi:hypothetical protein
MNEHPHNTILTIDLLVQSIKKNSQVISIKIKNQYPALLFLIPLLNYFNIYPLLTIGFIVCICLFFSTLMLNLLFLLLVMDCFILSFLTLQNISLKEHSHRLGKNIIMTSILYFNPLSSITTIILACVIYTKYNESTNKIAIKFMENALFIVFTNVPILNIIYPNYKQISTTPPVKN